MPMAPSPPFPGSLAGHSKLTNLLSCRAPVTQLRVERNSPYGKAMARCTDEASQSVGLEVHRGNYERNQRRLLYVTLKAHEEYLQR
jgi:hypothetical protein